MNVYDPIQPHKAAKWLREVDSALANGHTAWAREVIVWLAGEHELDAAIIEQITTANERGNHAINQ